MPEFKNKKEWENFVDQGLASGKTPQEMNSLAGKYEGPEGKFTVQQAAKSKRGWTPRNYDLRLARDNRRSAIGKKQDAELLDTLKIGGVSDEEASGILKKEKAKYTRIEDQARELNKVHGKNAFNAGHETAAIQGGGNYGRNARLEIGKSRVRADGTTMRGNQSRGQLDEIPDNIKPVMGIPRSQRGGKDTALYNLLERDVPGIMDLGLTPYDRQEIKRNPASADDIITRRQQQLSLPKPNPKPAPVPTPTPAPTTPNVGTQRATLQTPKAFDPKAAKGLIKKLSAASLLGFGTFGTAADAAETALRTQVAAETKDPADALQAVISAAAGTVGATGIGEVLGIPLEVTNMLIDQHRAGGATPMGGRSAQKAKERKRAALRRKNK